MCTYHFIAIWTKSFQSKWTERLQFRMWILAGAQVYQQTNTTASLCPAWPTGCSTLLVHLGKYKTKQRKTFRNVKPLKINQTKGWLSKNYIQSTWEISYKWKISNLGCSEGQNLPNLCYTQHTFSVTYNRKYEFT